MNRNAIVAIVVFLVVCSSLAVGTMTLYTAEVRTDPETLCPLEGPAAGYVGLLLDATDPWSEEQLAGLRSQIRKIAATLRTGEKFAVFELPAIAPTVPKPKFAMCSPGNGSDANPMTQGTKLLRDRFEAKFMAPLDAYVSSLRTLHSAPTTPLLEVLSAISAGDSFQLTVGRRVLYVGSDMLENYAGIRHYRANIGKYADFAKTARGKELSANLKGVQVHILYLINPNSSMYQGEQHIAWYREYVSASGGTLVGVEPL